MLPYLRPVPREMAREYDGATGCRFLALVDAPVAGAGLVVACSLRRFALPGTRCRAAGLEVGYARRCGCRRDLAHGLRRLFPLCLALRIVREDLGNAFSRRRHAHLALADKRRPSSRS